MKAGFFKVCINPPVGTAMEGLKLDAPCTSIHDDLFVRTLYLTHRKTEALIVTFDLLFFLTGPSLIGLKPPSVKV